MNKDEAIIELKKLNDLLIKIQPHQVQLSQFEAAIKYKMQQLYQISNGIQPPTIGQIIEEAKNNFTENKIKEVENDQKQK
jgi:hypothetical protein